MLVKALQEFLVLSLFNHNDYYPDTDLGCSTFELANLLDAASWEGVNSVILKDGEVRGQLIYDVSYYPVRRATMVYEKEELSETSSYLPTSLSLRLTSLRRRWYSTINRAPSQGP